MSVINKMKRLQLAHIEVKTYSERTTCEQAIRIIQLEHYALGSSHEIAY